MNRAISLLLLLSLLFFSASTGSSTECDCSIYPFKPNPPCYGHCVGKLSSQKNVDLSTVKGKNVKVS